MNTNSPLNDFPAVATIPVQWGDQDSFQHVNNAVYFRWFESSRVQYWHQSGLFDALKESGFGPILASVTCNYKRQIKFPDTVLIGSKVEKLGVSSVTIGHEVFSQSNNAVSATGKSVIVLFDYQSQHPVPIAEEFRNIFEVFEEQSKK
jgi:acyl-CoA thioester hydrolase